MAEISIPPGCKGVLWADGVTHAIRMAEYDPDGGPLWQAPVACHTIEPGVDPALGVEAIHQHSINCDACITAVS